MLIKREREKSLLKPREVQQWRASGPQDRIDGSGGKCGGEGDVGEGRGGETELMQICVEGGETELASERFWEGSSETLYTGGVGSGSETELGRV